MTEVLEFPKILPPSLEVSSTAEVTELIQVRSTVTPVQTQQEQAVAVVPQDDLPKLSAGNKKEQLLERNTTIKVTVDDLNEGLIVVSYLHNDNLYQGVLLQLNRERGIPCGISFPKEICPGSNGAVDGDGNDPTQISPINQRNTYFQDNTAESRIGPKSRVALRRVIKPPARYKNSRNNLRLRTRPVLCVKCRALCDEKTAAVSNNNENSNESTDKRPSSSTTNHTVILGVTTRRGYAKSLTKPDSVSNGTDNSNDATEDPLPEEDFTFTSIGSKGIVDNYWKRPLMNELTDESKEITTNLLTVSLPKLVLMKSVSPTMPELKPATTPEENFVSTNSTNTSNALKNPILLKSLTAPPKHPNQYTKNLSGSTSANQTKTRNLKLCINKLRNDRSKSFNEHQRKRVVKTTTTNTAETSMKESNLEKHIPSAASVRSPPTTASANIASTSVNELVDALSSNNNGVQKSSSNNSKNDDANARKRSSTVPVRYRDEKYVTKNDVFSFKRRRIGEEETLISSPGSSSNSSISSAISNSESLTKDISSKPGTQFGRLDGKKIFNLPPLQPSPSISNLCSIKLPSDVPQQKPALTHKPSSLVSSNCISSTSSTSTTTTSSTISSTTAASCSGSAIHTVSNTSSEAANKTPVIKITFGSSGNGVVLQIPPKKKQKAPDVEPSIADSNSKADRKAMKKARKEAKKKRSSGSPDISSFTSSSKKKADGNVVSSSSVNRKPPALIPNASRLLHSPSPPVLNREYSIGPSELHINSGSNNSNLPNYNLEEPVEPVQLVHVLKKKKKDKRKKRPKSSSKLADKSGSGSCLLKNALDNNTCTSSSGSNMNVLILSQDAQLRRLYHPLEDPSPTSDHDSDDLNSSAPILKNELLESLKYESTQKQNTSEVADAHQERLCISLKRLDSNSNAYVSCGSNNAGSSKGAVSSEVTASTSNGKRPAKKPSTSKTTTIQFGGFTTNLDNGITSTFGTSNTETSDDSPANNEGSPEHDENYGGSADSLDCYSLQNPPCTFRKGDIIWGKLSGCPWWPGKIVDILYIDGTEYRAKVYWYQATTQSCVRFSMLVPFEEFFEFKFNRNRRRGSYKQAVREALIETNRLNPEDLPSD